MQIPAKIIHDAINDCQRVNINDIIQNEIDEATTPGIDELQEIVKQIEEKYDIWIQIEAKWGANPGSDLDD